MNARFGPCALAKVQYGRKTIDEDELRIAWIMCSTSTREVASSPGRMKEMRLLSSLISTPKRSAAFGMRRRAERRSAVKYAASKRVNKSSESTSYRLGSNRAA